MKGTKTLLSYLIFIIGLQWKTIYVNAEECGVNYFKCKKNGKCILGAFRCDGELDCDEDDGDKSDEENCRKTSAAQCPVTDFQCKNGKCISKYFTCDHADDCGDNSDESATDGPLCTNSDQCPTDMFQCKKSGKCIYTSYKCDGDIDCGENDSSDEDDCDMQCASNEFKCNDFKCIDKDWICDGMDDCGDNTDEINCTTTAAPPIATTKPKRIASTKKPTKLPGQLTTGLNCDIFSFRCPKDNRCIHEKWLCDGMRDCIDGHDENPDMCKKKCGSDEFKCLDGSCIKESQKCDGISQCSSGEDELLPQCNVSVPCTEKTYKCQQSNKCLSEENVCDRIRHCPLGDDEGEKCGLNECSVSNGGCSHHCVDKKVGHSCECPFGYHLKKDGKTCEDINECLMPGVCSQYCFNEMGSYRCGCDEGYELLPDKKKCKVKAPLPYLVFSNGKEIREVSTNFRDYKMVMKRTENAEFINADISNGMIYWTNQFEKKIYRAPKDGSKAAQVLIDNVSPSSLALDWIGQKLYWIEAEQNKIVASNLDGSHIKSILKGSVTDKFESLDITPEKGLLYFTNHGSEPKIESISLDGSNRNVIVGKSHAKFASMIKIDRVLEKLYWVNQNSHQIISSNLDGKTVNPILKLNETIISGLTVFEDYLYFTSEKSNHIYKVNKYTGKNEAKLNKFIRPSDIFVYHPAAQKQVFHPCQKSNGGCSHLCFVSDLKTRICDCPDSLKLYSDKKTCIPKEISTVTEKNKCGGYVCKVSKQCIPRKLLCNGVKNCALNDDEMNCDVVSVTNTNPENQRKARNDQKTKESSGSHLFIIIGSSVGVLLLLVIIAVAVCHYRKKTKQADVRMVFKKDNEAIHDKRFDDKLDTDVKYVPTFSTFKNTKNFDNKNFDESKTPLRMDGECMVDQADSSDSSSIDFDESQPIIS